jgi:hypothetical protein
VHRWLYQQKVGPIGDLQLDHLCRVRHCINPAHLEPVTGRENVIRGLAPILARLRAALITHCRYGHPFEGANVYVSSRGVRQCKECGRRRNGLRYARLKAASLAEDAVSHGFRNGLADGAHV